MENLQSLVERVLTPVGKSGNENIYLCPKCNDTSGHLYVNYDLGYYNCVRCGQFKGRSLYSLLKYLHIDCNYDYSILESNYERDLDTFISESKETYKPRLLDYSTNLYSLTQYFTKHCTELSYNARNYLYHRGLSDYYIDKFNIKEGINLYGQDIQLLGKLVNGRDYSGRIMIPSLRKDGLISYFVARDYLGGREPRYLNPPKDLAYSSEDVWNLDIVETNYVIICEGVFTSLAVNLALGKNCSVATYGKSIADKSNNSNNLIVVTSQGEKLLNRKFSTYFVFYDKDAKKEAFKTMRYLNDRGAEVRYVSIDNDNYGPKADAADLTKEELIYCINNSRIYDKFLEFDLYS